MLRAGTFATPKETFYIYEVDEAGCYRLDFVKDGGNFMYDVDKIVYSIFKKKGPSMARSTSLYLVKTKSLATQRSLHLRTVY